MLFFQVFLCDMNMDGASLVLAWSTHLRKCSSSEEFKIASLHWNIYIYIHILENIYTGSNYLNIYIYDMNRFHTPQRSDINPSSKHASSFTCQHLPTQAKAGSTMAGLPVARNTREVCHDGNLDFPEFRQRISKNESQPSAGSLQCGNQQLL